MPESLALYGMMIGIGILFITGLNNVIDLSRGQPDIIVCTAIINLHLSIRLHNGIAGKYHVGYPAILFIICIGDKDGFNGSGQYLPWLLFVQNTCTQ